MKTTRKFVHPYIPNSAPAAEEALLKEIGESSVENLFNVIPADLKLGRLLHLPNPLLSEYELKKHVNSILNKNQSCEEYLSFLGAGCYQHYVPAVCDEISSRAEFLTAYWGDTYSDFGKWQAMFEYQSLLGELLELDVVSTPTYDWAAAAGSALMMAVRLTGRRQVLIAGTVNKERSLQINNFCLGRTEISTVKYDPVTGMIDVNDLNTQISDNTAAVYFENPNALGILERQGSEITAIARSKGAMVVVGVDPTTLGIVAPPVTYGADITCGDAGSLGNHMSYGGGSCGFIASQDEERIVSEYPTLLVSIAQGDSVDQWAFGECTHERTSYVKRGVSPDFIGTSQWLYGITAGVYLASLGPIGIRELGEGIMSRSNFAAQAIAKIRGIKVPYLSSPFFKEIVVDFNATGQTVSKINQQLLEYGIFGGKDMSLEFPELGQSALYCITEIHSLEDIKRLVKALEEVIR